MDKVTLRDGLYKTTYAWYSNRDRSLYKFYKEMAQRGVDVSYDPIGETLHYTITDGKKQLPIIFSRNEHGERIVDFPTLGKRDSFRPNQRHYTVMAFPLAVAINFFEAR
jgi:hypothetical protein